MKKPEESANWCSPSAETLQNVAEFYEAMQIVKTEKRCLTIQAEAKNLSLQR